MKPFLLLSHRPEDIEAERELTDIARFAGLRVGDFDQRRLEQEPLGDVDLTEYSGVIIAGGPFNVSDAEKSHTQQRVEREMLGVVTDCLQREVPLLGVCYGMGVLALAAGAVVDREFGEEASAPWIALTAAGSEDALTSVLPESFRAFTGHKEAMSTLPEGAVVLASNEACPHQIVRFGPNAHAVQFHPELDGNSLAERLIVYQDFGYFPAGELDERVGWARSERVDEEVHHLFRRFVELHAKD